MEGPVDAGHNRQITKYYVCWDHDQRESAVSTCKNFNIESDWKFASVKVGTGGGKSHLKERLRTKADIWDAGSGTKGLARPGRRRDEHHAGNGTWRAVERDILESNGRVRRSRSR